MNMNVNFLKTNVDGYHQGQQVMINGFVAGLFLAEAASMESILPFLPAGCFFR